MAASLNVQLEDAVRRYADTIKRYLRSRIKDPNDTDDVFQNVCLKALRYDNFEGRSDIGTWLYAIAKREVSGYYRIEQRDKKRVSQAEIDDLPSKSENPEEVLMKNERGSFARRIAAEAQGNGRKIESLILSSQDLSHIEIAERLGIPVGTVKSRMHYARQELRQQYGTEYRQY